MPTKSKRLDPEPVRQAAAGRWVEILHSVGGIPLESLDDSQEHPCPKCAGATRFRLVDQAAGAVRCSHCFAEKCGDGFAAIGWMLGVKFPEAVKLVAKYCGVAASKDDADPAKDLEWMAWATPLADRFAASKPGVTERAMLDCGARMARYKRSFTVIAFPVVGPELDVGKPIGWAIYNHNGAPLPRWNKQGEIVGSIKVKLTFGSKPGLVGAHAIERLATPGMVELCWKVEGLSDMLALQSIIPESLRDRHVVVTNANGAGEIPRWPAATLAVVNCHLVHDADKPGQVGAENWTKQIAAQAASGVAVKNVTLPYVIEETHGNDLRDWIGEGHGYADLLALAEQCVAVTVARTASGEVDLKEIKYPHQELILKKLCLEVLYEDEEGRVRVFSTFLRKSSTIRDVARMKYEQLIQMCGSPAMEHVVKSAADAGDDAWTMEEIRKAISILCSNRRGKNDERGVGVWQGLDEWENETETIVLVGNSEGARWNGDKVLRRIVAPRADGLVLDFGAASKDWYDFELLERHLASAADVGWRQKAISEAVAIFSMWRWQHQEIDPTLVTGLVVASFVQTIFEWRPLIAVKGESHCGKSYLFKAMGGDQNQRGLFGNLAYAPDQSSEPGIRQHIGNTARVVLLDELEKSKERERILQMLRSSTRGGTISKGTGGAQRGTDFTIRHIVWTSATEAGLHKQPDINRYIQFELLIAEKGKAGQLRLPDGRLLYELGQKLLAVAVYCGIEAKRLAKTMKDIQVPGIDARTVESYSVPAAMLAVAEGHGADVAKALLIKLLGSVDQTEQGRTDQEELLGDIMTASVHLDSREGVKTVAQVLESPGLRVTYGPRLESVGVRMLDDYSLFIAPKLVSQQLLKGTTWEGLRIDQILGRIPGATRRAMKLAGRSIRGMVIPAAAVDVREPQQTF